MPKGPTRTTKIMENGKNISLRRTLENQLAYLWLFVCIFLLLFLSIFICLLLWLLFETDSCSYGHSYGYAL